MRIDGLDQIIFKGRRNTEASSLDTGLVSVCWILNDNNQFTIVKMFSARVILPP